MNIEYEFNQLVNFLILERLIKTINYIHYKLPKLFTKNNKDELINSLINNKIKIIPKTPKTKYKLQRKIDKYYLKSKVYNKGIVITKKSTLSQVNRCQARIWGNAYMKINKTNDITYGLQCSHQKKESSNYCLKHLKNNKHGDYNKEPNCTVIKEYLKYNTNIKKNILDNCKTDE